MDVTEPLAAGRWLNSSRRMLLLLAIATAAVFLLLCGSILYFTAYYFVCPADSCQPNGRLPALLGLSTIFALIPTIGTGAIGWLIVRGLVEDSRRPEERETTRSG